jgi:hypothetical protein
MGVGRTAWQASLATALLLVGCAPGDADTTDPAWEDGAPVPADASVDDDVGPRPEVDAALAPRRRCARRACPTRRPPARRPGTPRSSTR